MLRSLNKNFAGRRIFLLTFGAPAFLRKQLVALCLHLLQSVGGGASKQFGVFVSYALRREFYVFGVFIE